MVSPRHSLTIATQRFQTSSFLIRQSTIVNRQSSILLFLLVWSVFTLGQTSGASFTIYGIVRLPNGEPASRVTVNVRSQSGLDRQAFSDDMGRYEIRDLPRGRYFLTVTNPQAPDQLTDPAEADTGRSLSGRVLVHLFLRAKVDSTRETSGSVISVREAIQQIPKPAQKAYEQAIKYRSDRKLDQALDSLSRAIDLYPAYFQAFSERGHLRIGLGQIGDAAGDFEHALQINDRYEPALRGSGLCKFQQGNFAEAVRELEKALAVDPGVAATYLFLGVAQLAQDHRQPARLALQKALSLDPKGSTRARVHLANLLIKENRFLEAADELRAYLNAAPGAPDGEKLRALESQLRASVQKP